MNKLFEIYKSMSEGRMPNQIQNLKSKTLDKDLYAVISAGQGHEGGQRSSMYSSSG